MIFIEFGNTDTVQSKKKSGILGTVAIPNFVPLTQLVINKQRIVFLFFPEDIKIII